MSRRDGARSLEPITRSDLCRLAAIANADIEDLFLRKPETARAYAGRMFCIALCQGGALHYLDGKNGIKDLDVWVFFEAGTGRAFPYRRRGQRDFGDPKFGRTPGDEGFLGRRVDILGRSLRGVDRGDPVETLRKYLEGGKTESARQLARKAVILLEPRHLLGTVVWPRPANLLLRAR